MSSLLLEENVRPQKMKYNRPVNRWGNLTGKMTASFRDSLAPSRPATSDHLMLGVSHRMAPGEVHKSNRLIQ